MYFFTHLFLSKTLYKHLLGQIKLDKRAFAYGNVKPDIYRPKPPLPHTLENYLFSVNEQAQDLIAGELSLQDFSEKLGVICHHLCDFFCYYHLNETIYHKKMKHFLYELALHYEVYRLFFSGQLKSIHKKKLPTRNITSLVLEMRNYYSQEPVNCKRDITFALDTVIWVCESILFYMKQPVPPSNESHIMSYALQGQKGGLY